MSNVETRLECALRAAAEASSLILSYYQLSGLEVESKRDESPVTVADRGAEQLMRERILENFADDTVCGEEFPDRHGSSGFRWILDPIDGTKAFIHGVPLFGTLIGIESAGQMVAGVCQFPALDEVVYAAQGRGAWWKVGTRAATPARVSLRSDLSGARLVFTEPSFWKRLGRFEIMQELSDQVGISRGWGDCFGHMMVATGRAEIAVDPQMSPWDIAALIPILREAGGYCGDWRGQESLTGGDGVSVNAALKERVLGILGKVPALAEISTGAA